jgi:hypothetical protein
MRTITTLFAAAAMTIGTLGLTGCEKEETTPVDTATGTMDSATDTATDTMESATDTAAATTAPATTAPVTPAP